MSSYLEPDDVACNNDTNALDEIPNDMDECCPHIDVLFTGPLRQCGLFLEERVEGREEGKGRREGWREGVGKGRREGRGKGRGEGRGDGEEEEAAFDVPVVFF